jgi:1-acyl-sn-glycerol-3-phosphate acyltransferase
MPGWRIRLLDRKNLNSKDSKVIVCNHQSLLDIPILYRLRKNFKFISKAGVFKVPFLGWVMYLNKYIGIERGTIKSMTKMMQDCVDNLKRGSSILIFPEGTRSEDGNLKPFRTGAFSLAKDNQKSIVPVIIKGTADLLTKNTLKMKPFKKITVKVLEEIPYDAIKDKPLIDIANSIHKLMSEEMEKL